MTRVPLFRVLVLEHGQWFRSLDRENPARYLSEAGPAVEEAVIAWAESLQALPATSGSPVAIQTAVTDAQLCKDAVR